MKKVCCDLHGVGVCEVMFILGVWGPKESDNQIVCYGFL